MWGWNTYYGDETHSSDEEEYEDEEKERRVRAARSLQTLGLLRKNEEADKQPPSPAHTRTLTGSGAASSTLTLSGSLRAGGDPSDVIQEHAEVARFGSRALDCYPYTFSPLLLFTSTGYFDPGFSNYNAVARFFEACFRALPSEPIDMLQDVLYERKNMLYDELYEEVVSKQMLIVCCIDAHFTALQVLPGQCGVYYDPMSSTLSRYSGKSFRRMCVYLLMKCHYGDNQHIQENKNQYKGSDATPLRQLIYSLWQDINDLKPNSRRLGVSPDKVYLDLDRYVFVNDGSDARLVACQLTGNTCYFQCYLFGVLCKVGGVSVPSAAASTVHVEHPDRLARATVALCKFLMTFFVDERFLRPLTNSNFVVDFYRFADSPYFRAVTAYLKHAGEPLPDYEKQYSETMRYFTSRKTLHKYGKFTLSGAMSSTLNTKWLQPVCGSDDAVYKLATSNYYKYRAVNFMFGFSTHIMKGLASFCEFNALRKNQLLAFYNELRPIVSKSARISTNRFRDYYFIGQFEVGQRELVDMHHYAYLIDMCSLGLCDAADAATVGQINKFLAAFTFFSTQRRHNYEKILTAGDFAASKSYELFLKAFMSVAFHHDYAALGFPDNNPREKDINSLTQTSFYSTDLMHSQAYRMEHEFEKECINQMARSTLRKYEQRMSGRQSARQPYTVGVKIGFGYTYSKYNTLMHFLNVMESYWRNPDMNHIQVFGKDIRTLLAVSCQKIFFDDTHSGYYHYGVLEAQERWAEMDLAVGTSTGHIVPSVSYAKYGDRNLLVLTERVYEYHYLRQVLAGLFERAHGVRVKTDNAVLNLSLLSLMLDFDLYEQHSELLNLPMLQTLVHRTDKKELQVEVANQMHEFERRNTADAVTRIQLEQLIFEASYKFLVNKGVSLRSWQSQLMQTLSTDSAYQQQLLLCKINMSLCQINKSVEVDYYKVRCNGQFRTIIPYNFSKSTGDYLEEVTKRYTFAEREGVVLYDDLPVFDVRALQPEMNLYRIRFDSKSSVQSMVKYVEIKNALRSVHFGEGPEGDHQYLVFIADNALVVDVLNERDVAIRVNNIAIEISTTFFNEAISFVPCFKYADGEDVILFTSPNIHYLVDQGGQFCTDYYGMKHELIENVASEEVVVDLNDEHVFKKYKLCDLVGESKTVIYFPDYLLQVSSRQQLINLLDLAIRIRNISFFILVLFLLRRCSVALSYIEKEDKVKKISGPWKAAILYVLNKQHNAHYECVFARQFFDLRQHADLPLGAFIDALCENFTKYQRYGDGGYEIVPRDKQKAFLRRIIAADECFHFSEVGSGKTKVILPLLCQAFLSDNKEVHRHLARGGAQKDVLVVLVPEHLVPDALTQVFRYCLNVNFREEFRVYDDVFALMHDRVHLGSGMKQIFVTSFNQFKKALTYDVICKKVYGFRDRVLVVVDEVDDFLDRDKLVFNICSNKSNAFDKRTLELYFETCRAAYHGEAQPAELFAATDNPEYWGQLHEKCCAIHLEIQDASKSLNKSFGIFNEQTLRHCHTNIAHDVEGYKSLIARPYESVNRAMPGSYYSDVERTIYLTYVIISEDIAKYDELFQQERKFISFEYWRAYLYQLDYDDLVYGEDRLSELVEKHPKTKDGLTRFLYEIILRRMEIRDRSRSVNSIDVVFNFDCIGFTGTPFIDNYPTFAYLRSRREDQIPDLIDRSFYAYEHEALSDEEFERRFECFQGYNNNVHVEYAPSDFVSSSSCELAVLEHIFRREERLGAAPPASEGAIGGAADGVGAIASTQFNVLVDLCGIFKRSSIHDVRDLVLKHFGPDRFHYVYHIDQADSSDRVLSVSSDNDVQFDEEFYKFLCKRYGAQLRDRVFFFVDNRNVIGKDVPFQLSYKRRFGQPMFQKSVVLAHDVDDFSKIWQAMGRSRTMNDTRFTIYKSGIPAGSTTPGGGDIRKQPFTRQLYIRNCDLKMTGNVSSIYQTLVSLYNLSEQSFYYRNEIVNTFLDKMERTIGQKLLRHEEQLKGGIVRAGGPARILQYILAEKFQRSTVPEVRDAPLSRDMVETLIGHIVQHKFEQRRPTGDMFDDVVRLLSGDQNSLMEISYTKQHQKQKQKQHNKNQDSDVMDVFARRNQISLTVKVDNYYEYTLQAEKDVPKVLLNLPLPIPVFALTYRVGNRLAPIRVYPTVQFLYSHHILADYITDAVRGELQGDPWLQPGEYCARFLERVRREHHRTSEDGAPPDGAFAVGQVVGLCGMGDAAYDGRAGEIVAARGDGQWDVRLSGDGSAPVSVTTANLRLSGSLEGTTAGHAAGHISSGASDAVSKLALDITINYVRQNPQYTIAGLEQGVYVIGMKDQLNRYDLQAHPLRDAVQYIADDHGFVLYDRAAEGGSPAAASPSRSVETFGPYFVEQYILMEVLSKQEVAQNVLDYYVHHREKLNESLQSYGEVQGKGFVCWRFVMNDSARGGAGVAASGDGAGRTEEEPDPKKRRLNGSAQQGEDVSD